MLHSIQDKAVDTMLSNVVNYLAPPTDFLHPLIMSKVLLYWGASQIPPLFTIPSSLISTISWIRTDFSPKLFPHTLSFASLFYCSHYL